MVSGGLAEPLEPHLAQLDRLTAAGVPAKAMLFYGRWWQLETWLRQMAYVIFRREFGLGWVARMNKQAISRAERDQVNDYMASADAGELLAYADAGHLFSLISEHWELFEEYLVPKLRWEGMVDALKPLRHRNAHLRRPHRDDVTRLEQTLRDVEPGARRFLSSYISTSQVDRASGDPLAKAWVQAKHETAIRLIEHAERQYQVRFRLAVSRARPAEANSQVSGTPGAVWHAHWTMADPVAPAVVWPDISRQTQDLIVHLLCDFSSVTATFAAVDDDQQIADAIGEIFDRLLENTRHWPAKDPDELFARWRYGSESLPSKVQVDSLLTLFDPYQPEAFSLFSA